MPAYRLAGQSILGIGTGQLPINELIVLMTIHSAEAMSSDIFRPRNSL